MNDETRASARQPFWTPRRKYAAREFLFPALMLLGASWALLTAMRWPDRSALFPVFTCIVLLALLLMHMLFAALSLRSGTDLTSGRSSARDVAFELGTSGVDMIKFVGWFLGFGLVLWGVGFVVGSFVSVFGYMTVRGRERWRVALPVALGITLMVWVIDSFFGLRFEPGVLF